MKKIILDIMKDKKISLVASTYSDICSELSFEDNDRFIKKMNCDVKEKFNELFKSLFNSGNVVNGCVSLRDIDKLGFNDSVKELFIQYMTVYHRVSVYAEEDFVYDSVDYYEDSVRAYFNEVGKYPLLSSDEERELFDRLRSGDESCREVLINSNLRLVVRAAKGFYSNSLSLLDLIQAGNIGLIKAVSKFDNNMGYRFSTYAMWWIRQSIYRTKAEQTNVIRLPEYMYRSVNKYLFFVDNYERVNGCLPSRDEILTKVDVDSNKLDVIQDVCDKVNPMSFEYPIGEDKGIFVKDLVADKDGVTPEDNILAVDSMSILSDILGILNDRERKVLALSYGLDNNERLTLIEIGKILGISSERARQIRARALEKLRIEACNSKYDEYRTDEHAKLLACGKKKYKVRK